MPPRRLISPKNLEELCLGRIVKYLERECSFCTEVRKYQYDSLLLRRRGINVQALEKEIESYLNILPPLLNELVRQHVTNEVLKSSSESYVSQPEIYLSLLAIVLNKDIKNLEISTDTDDNFLSPVWQIVTKKCTGLKRFLLTRKVGFFYRHRPLLDIEPSLRKVISNNTTLSEVILKDVIQGHETLSLIGRNCPNLKVLDITGSMVSCVDLAHLFVHSPKSRNINIGSLLEGSLELPCSPICSSLEVLILAKTNVEMRGAALAVKFLTKLISLGSFSYLPSALKHLYGTISKPPNPLKIVRGTYYGPSHTKLRALSNCCPKLEVLQIGYHSMRGIDPSYLVYKHLRNLILENVEFDALLACTTILPQLIELKLSTVGIDVGLLGQHCQNLEHLWLSGEPIKILSQPANCEPYSKLKKLKMPCLASAECVGYIIRRALKLQVIEIGRVKELNDMLFAEWLQWNPLQHLESLMIYYAELTHATVDLLLEHCPQLTRLSGLGGWDIQLWERQRLKNLIHKEKYKLDLILNIQSADINISDIDIDIDILTESTSSSDEELSMSILGL